VATDFVTGGSSGSFEGSDSAPKMRQGKGDAMALTRAAVVAGFAILASGGAAPSSAQAGHVSIGYTYTHTRFNCPDAQPGGPKGMNDAETRGRQKMPSVNSADSIVLHYDQPSIRAQVDATLKAMRAGADALRLLVWIGGSDVRAESGPQVHLGLFSDETNVPPVLLSNISGITKKAASLGYSKVYIVFGNQGATSPKCSKTGRTGCFNGSHLAGDWNVRKQVIDAARLGSSAGTSVYFDLAGESCPGGGGLPEVQADMQQFVGYMVKQYAKVYGDDHSFVSCHGRSLKRAKAGLDSIVALYRSAGIRPHTLDLHIYVPDEQVVKDVLTYGESVAQSTGWRLSVLETAYDDQAVFSAIAALRQHDGLPLFETLVIWPKTLDSNCGFTIQWPADLSNVNRIVNG
jgi:hypothetical protein